MTDARLPERLLTDRRYQTLPLDAFKSYHVALIWSVSNRTEGFITPDDLPLILGFILGAEQTLTEAGLWLSVQPGWWIERFDHDQTTRAKLESAERKRIQDRAGQARHRAKKPDDDEPPPDHEVTRDVTRDFIGQDRTGQARTGQALEENVTEASEVDSGHEIDSSVQASVNGEVASRKQLRAVCTRCGFDSVPDGHTMHWDCAREAAEEARQ